MIVAAIIGIVVGYLLAIPPGPVGVAAIRTGIRQGWHASLRLAAGAGLFDVLYCAGAMLATSAIVAELKALETSSPIITIIIQLGIVAVLIVFGVIQFRERHTELFSEKKPGTADRVQLGTGEPSDLEDKGLTQRFLKRMRRTGPFFLGVGFAVANLANPAFIPSLAAMTTFIQKLELFPDTVTNALVFASGFGLGNLLWLATLSRLVIAYRERMTPRFIQRIQQLSGATLISFGTLYGIRLLAITKWTDVFRLAFAF